MTYRIGRSHWIKPLGFTTGAQSQAVLGAAGAGGDRNVLDLHYIYDLFFIKRLLFFWVLGRSFQNRVHVDD